MGRTPKVTGLPESACDAQLLGRDEAVILVGDQNRRQHVPSRRRQRLVQAARRRLHQGTFASQRQQLFRILLSSEAANDVFADEPFLTAVHRIDGGHQAQFDAALPHGIADACTAARVRPWPRCPVSAHRAAMAQPCLPAEHPGLGIVRAVERLRWHAGEFATAQPFL